MPDPRGSDLWLGEYSAKKKPQPSPATCPTDISAPRRLRRRERRAPSSLSVTWPLDNRTPWSGPLLAGGVLLLLRWPRALPVGADRACADPAARDGSRRRPPRCPSSRDLKAIRQLVREPSWRPRVVARSAAWSPSSRWCSSGPSPPADAHRTSGRTAADIGQASASRRARVATPAAAELDPPVVSVPQVENILADVSAVATKADTDRDATLLATRFAGPALELRLANYAIRDVDASLRGSCSDPREAYRADPPAAVEHLAAHRVHGHSGCEQRGQ